MRYVTIEVLASDRKGRTRYLLPLPVSLSATAPWSLAREFPSARGKCFFSQSEAVLHHGPSTDLQQGKDFLPRKSRFA